jgi:hypothetical protein
MGPRMTKSKYIPPKGEESNYLNINFYLNNSIQE